MLYFFDTGLLLNSFHSLFSFIAMFVYVCVCMSSHYALDFYIQSLLSPSVIYLQLASFLDCINHSICYLFTYFLFLCFYSILEYYSCPLPIMVFLPLFILQKGSKLFPNLSSTVVIDCSWAAGGCFVFLFSCHMWTLFLAVVSGHCYSSWHSMLFFMLLLVNCEVAI